MSRSRQHIVPRRDLVRFSDVTGKFYYFRRDRVGGGIEYRNPRSVMWRRGYYDLVDPDPSEHTGSVEDRLQQAEEEANRIIDEVLVQISDWRRSIPDDCSECDRQEAVRRFAQHSPLRLSGPDVDTLKCWIAWKLMRTDMRIKVEAVTREKVKKDAAEKFGQDKVDAIDEDWFRRRTRDINNRKVGQGPGPYVKAVLATKGLVVSTPIKRHTAPLVAGDNPVIKPYPKGMNLSHKRAQINMPISKDTVLSIHGSPGIRFDPALDNSGIGSLNKTTFFQSNEVVCACKEVLESLIRADRKGNLRMQAE